MSLPDFLTASYKQYKLDTDKIATWLAETARKVGYGPDIGELEESISQKTPKSKGRARKLAREASHSSGKPKAPVAEHTSSPQQNFTIALHDFIPLANFIAAYSNPPIDVPVEFLTIAKRAIAARKRCTEWFIGNATDDERLRESNRKHGYFIGILEETLSALRPRCPPGTIDDPLMKAADEAKAGQPDPLHLSNMFNALSVEETTEDYQNLEIPPQPSPATARGNSDQPKRRQYQVTHPKSAEEIFFATFCFFDDLNKFRKLLRELWL